MSRIAVMLAAFFASCFPMGNREFEQNPDLNHTHADFVVWEQGQMVDFTDNKYMSGVSYDDDSHDEEDEYLHKYLHLHDNIGTVLHRHKPGLTLGEFFESLGYSFADRPWQMLIINPAQEGDWQVAPLDLEYVFEDMDRILITDAADQQTIDAQLKTVTDEACRFSRTCPWRGDPPAENCIADPAVPCVAPLEDY